jgi:hypothetical protein
MNQSFFISFAKKIPYTTQQKTESIHQSNAVRSILIRTLAFLCELMFLGFAFPFSLCPRRQNLYGYF